MLLEDRLQPCVKLKLIPNINQIILEEFTTVSRNLPYVLDIMGIGITGNEKMTVFKGTLRKVWEACQQALVFSCC